MARPNTDDDGQAAVRPVNPVGAIKSIVMVLRCTACGFKRTQSPPLPETCPRCGAKLVPPRDRFELEIRPTLGHSPPPPEQSCVSESAEGWMIPDAPAASR